MSDGVELFWTGGDPIDSRSSRTSVPAFGAWLVPISCRKRIDSQ